MIAFVDYLSGLPACDLFRAERFRYNGGVSRLASLPLLIVHLLHPCQAIPPATRFPVFRPGTVQAISVFALTIRACRQPTNQPPENKL